MSRFSLIFIILLTGCQLVAPREAGWTMLGDGYYQLLDRWQGQPQQLVQQISWQNKAQQQQFLLTVLLQRDTTLIVAISPLGQELWRMQYSDGHKMTLSGVAPFNQPAFARNLLAQMQLALLDEPLLTPRLQGLVLQQEADRRTLLDARQHPVLQVDNPGQISEGDRIILSGPDYQLTILTLQRDLLP